MNTKQLYHQVAERLFVKDAAGALQLVRREGDPNDCRVYALEAYVLEFQSRITESERMLRRAQRKFPREAFAHMALGEFCLDYRTKREALTHLDRALDLVLAAPAPRRQGAELGEEIVKLMADAHVGRPNSAARIQVLARGLENWPRSTYLRGLMLDALKELQPRKKTRGKLPLGGV